MTTLDRFFISQLVALYPKLLPRKFKFTSSLYEDKNHLISDIESIGYIVKFVI